MGDFGELGPVNFQTSLHCNINTFNVNSLQKEQNLFRVIVFISYLKK